jgi:nucleotide-binding universal stress UspA family protein
MYTKILVAVDQSETGRLVFLRALEIARATQAELMLVHGLSSEEEGSPVPLPPPVDGSYWMPDTASAVNFDIWRESWERYESEGIDRLRQFAAMANEQNVATEFRQIVGIPGKVICNLARQWGANLIVIGNRGRSGLTELMLGSVSSYVMHRASCSVLVLRGDLQTQVESVEKTTAAV